MLESDIQEASQTVKKLWERLYRDGNNGDICAINAHLARLNGQVEDHAKQINKIWIIISLLLGSISTVEIIARLLGI